jgi:acyl-homoserine lactone acylase PvdQ
VPRLGESARDAWFGLGFDAAQDRLAQLDFLVRAAQPRQVLGPKRSTPIASRARSASDASATRSSRASTPPRRVLGAHAAGISAWIEG